MEVEIDPVIGDGIVYAERLVVGFLAPRVWNAAENTKVTYINKTMDPGVVKTMSLIPDNEFPKNQEGLSWPQALRKKYGIGPNVLDDMQWVVFWSDEMMDVSNGQKMDVDVTIEAITGPENMNVKLGFFVNHTDDGLGTDEKHYDVSYTPCFEVFNGEDPFLDFCELHFNMVQPLNVTQDDIMTIKFEGGVQSNPLDNFKEVYLNIVARTDAGKEYRIPDASEKTKMTLENEYTRTYAITFWPRSYFNIPEGETIVEMKYYFMNQSGTAWVKETEDDGNGNESEVPFDFQFVCK